MEIRSQIGYRRESAKTPCSMGRKGEKEIGRSSQKCDGARKKQGVLVSACSFSIPCNLLILALAGFNLETSVVHVVYVPGGLEVAEDVILKFGHRLEEIGDVLVLLDVSDDLGGLGSLVEVDQFGWCERGNAVLDERQISQIDTCTQM